MLFKYNYNNTVGYYGSHEAKVSSFCYSSTNLMR